MPSDLVHIALGGTISMRVTDGLAVPALGAGELIELAGIDALAVDLARIGGPQIDFPLLARLHGTLRDAERDGRAGAIVTLGTDAIEEVAAFIAYTGPWTLPIAVTGAMAPGAEPGSDAPANLRDAAAVLRGVRLPEPVVVFAGDVFLARAVIKVSGLAREAFTAPVGPAWTVAGALSDGALRDAPPPPAGLGSPGTDAPEVPIIVSAVTAGGGDWLRVLEVPPAVVFVAAGAGNLTTGVARFAQRVLAGGAVAAIATRALDRQVAPLYGYAGGSGVLAGDGAVLAEGMTPHRLRMFLLIGLSQGLRGGELRERVIAHVDAVR